jgi:acetaldehyde dehydrogenase/alcohol dehydrogenase
MKRFLVRPEIYYGSNALSYLEGIEGKRAFIVTDPFMVKLGIVAKVTDVLEKKHIAYEVFDEVEPDPSLETVKKGLNQIIYTKPDLLIAIGGGSSIDAAKAIMCFCIHLKEKFVDTHSIKKPWFVAIPTTSGTGSEVTSYSVVTDKANNMKIPLNEALMIPDVAILDADLTKTVPPSVTGDTGMDVLTHALEAYVSVQACDYTDIYAEKAIKIVFEYLLRAFKDGSDMEARAKLHNGSCMAGIAFTNATLGINHSLAHAFGAKFKLSHGRSNAIFLPYVIKFNAGLKDGAVKNLAVAERYASIAKMLNFPAATAGEGTRSLIEGIKVLNAVVGIPTAIGDMNISKDEFEGCIPEMVEGVLKDICTPGNPIHVAEKDIGRLFREAFKGLEGL